MILNIRIDYEKLCTKAFYSIFITFDKTPCEKHSSGTIERAE